MSKPFVWYFSAYIEECLKMGEGVNNEDVKKRIAQEAADIRRFQRHDDEWTSMLCCACGGVFTWGEMDQRLRSWVNEHKHHNT